MKNDDVKALFVVTFKALAAVAHANARSKGFWSLMEELRSHPRAAEIETIWKLSRIDLMHSEASEATEGIRKNLPDDHLPQFSMETTELADVIIRIFDYVGAYDLPVAEAIVAKMEYNSTRPYMHGNKKA